MYSFFIKLWMDTLVDMSTYVQFHSDAARYPLSEKDRFTLKKKYATTNKFEFSSFNLIVDMWNLLPFHVSWASSISSFKRGVKNFLANTNWRSWLSWTVYSLSLTFGVTIFFYFVLLYCTLLVCLSMGSLTLLRTILMAFFRFSFCCLFVVFSKLLLNWKCMATWQSVGSN